MKSHKMIDRLASAEIRIILLDFPRSVTDRAYLFRMLRPILPNGVTEAAVLAAQRRLADRGKIRVGDELDAAPPPVLGFETPETVDRVALRREVARLRKLADAAEAEVARANQEAEHLRRDIAIIRASTSWRITRPWRAAGRWFDRHRR